MIKLELRVWRKTVTEVKGPRGTQSGAHGTSRTAPPTITSSTWVRQECKVTIFPFLTLSSVSGSKSSHTQGSGISFHLPGREYLRILFELFSKGDFSSPPFYLCNHLFISIWTHVDLFCIWGYYPI